MAKTYVNISDYRQIYAGIANPETGSTLALDPGETVELDLPAGDEDSDVLLPATLREVGADGKPIEPAPAGDESPEEPAPPVPAGDAKAADQRVDDEAALAAAQQKLAADTQQAPDLP